MAGLRVSETLRWFGEQSTEAPAALRARAKVYLERQPEHPDRAVVLAAAARDALASTLARPGDRTVALDLLAADALVTLALKARAVSDPAGLGRLAGELAALGSGIR
jgi:hypothetical protein